MNKDESISAALDDNFSPRVQCFYAFLIRCRVKQVFTTSRRVDLSHLIPLIPPGRRPETGVKCSRSVTSAVSHRGHNVLTHRVASNIL